MNTNQEMYWYGLEGPCVIGTLKIINGSGTIGPEQNIGHAKILVKHISDNLKLPDKKYENNKIILFNRIMYKHTFLFQHINIVCRTRPDKCYNFQYYCIKLFAK